MEKKKLGKPISAFRNQDYLYAQYNLHKKETLQNLFLQNPIQPISTFVCPPKKKKVEDEKNKKIYTTHFF
jgi:hypothetical protein